LPNGAAIHSFVKKGHTYKHINTLCGLLQVRRRGNWRIRKKKVVQCGENGQNMKIFKPFKLKVAKSGKVYYNIFTVLAKAAKKMNDLPRSAHGRIALTGEIAVPCTCNPLQQE